MPPFKRLLAKSVEGGEACAEPSHLLAGHLADVHAAAVRVLAASGDDQLRALGLPPGRWRDRFERLATLAAALHDLGKANDQFQGLVRGRRDAPQGLRHEWATLLILLQPAVADWLRPALPVAENSGADDWHLLLAAVAGHHPKSGRPSPPQEAPHGSGLALSLLLGHADFRACLGWLQATFHLAEPPALADVRVSLLATAAGGAFQLLAGWARRAHTAWEGCDPDTRRLLAALKACLIGADVAGSALPQALPDAPDRWFWVGAALARVPTQAQLREVVAERRGNQELRPFQARAAQGTARATFVRAGCGSGKTLLAYHWAAERHPGRRLYFCYPTTGTATEGFRDYLLDADLCPRHGADLFHGRALVDLEMLGATEDDGDDALLRIDSLDAWATPIVACTVDTVLGLVQNHRRGLYAWPALAGAAFVFDEVHAFDDALFGALLAFLRHVQGVPVLLMTASLPAHRLQALRGTLAEQGETLDEIAGPEELERLPRYHREEVPVGGLGERVGAELARPDGRGKVLWVGNTVRRVMAFADGVAGLGPRVYHSRFRYEDRVERHREVVEAFRTDGPALAVCSQVAEMSLDLSATLLVTDLAPVPALIQRLGRLNRRAQPGAGPPRTCPFVVVEPLDADGRLAPLPYAAEELEQARRWLAALGAGPLSQADLAACWEDLGEQGTAAMVATSAWLEGGPATTVRELREASPGLTVLLHRDLARARSGVPLVRLLLPMPSPPAHRDWRRWPTRRGVPVAPEGTISYDPIRGGDWA